MSFFFQSKVGQGVEYLDEEESRHCVKVMRRQVGDEIRVADGQGYFYKAQITEARPRRCVFRVLESQKVDPDPFYIHIALSPTKNNDRNEWFVEKATELGVHRISFILCDHSERRVLKTERLEKKAVAAMKQSQRAYLPQLHPLTDIGALLRESEEAEKFIAYLDEEPPVHLTKLASPRKTYLVLIGPEGDFSPSEVETALQQNCQTVSLGPHRLRTETAGMAACHMLHLLNQMA
jgi:16S rRNA (uracil1498-N3)-methyltransferase